MNQPAPLRIAMWSGPRNISTAMMRSWGNRPDTCVVDEPFYAHYLQRTRADHPGADEVIATGEADWQKVVAQLTGAGPTGRRILYQKQMTHHLLPHIDRGWLRGLTNCFLIRDPRDVIISYMKKNHDPTVEDLGFVQQAEIYDWVRKYAAAPPPILDAGDVLRNPRRALQLLCDAIGVEFFDSMLTWPPGARETDGVWAKHWYAEVERSTSFRPYQVKDEKMPERLELVYAKCAAVYERLHRCRLK